jgi:hypothetical protein
MSANEFPYASLLERSVGCSKKSFHQQETQQLQQSFRIGQLPHSVTSAGVGGHIEWKPEHFPHKMYDLLDDVERKGLDDIVSWLPDGKSFKIHSQIGFEQSIMPLYFSGMSSYKSFRRQLNLYGIYQHRHRPNQDANAYSHDLLIRGQRHLCDKIARKKTNPPSKSKTGSSSSKSGHGIDKSSSSSNKKRSRSSLLAMMDKRNMTSSSEPRSQQDSMVAPSSVQSNKGIDSMRRNMMIKSIYDDEMSTRPNPVDVAKLSKDTISIYRTVNTGNVFQSFMSQYWEDLPNNMSSAQVVDEIINTFQPR